MSDYEHRAKVFLAWLEARILQRECAHSRMHYCRGCELLRSEIGEARVIRDRLVAFPQGAPIVHRPAAAESILSLGDDIGDDSKPDAGPDAGTKPRVVH